MRAELYEIANCPHGRLAIMPRPRGGEWLRSEMVSLINSGVTDLVSMLTPAEERELTLLSEADECAAAGIQFHRFPVADRGIPAQPNFDQLMDGLASILVAGGFIAIHCRAGIGRSAVAVAALLCRGGVSPSDAVSMISHARGFDIPDTDEQLDFILSFDQR